MTVTVEDGKGGSASIDVTVSVTDVKETPDAPAGLAVVEARSGSLTVSWAAPANTGRPDITDYDYRYRTSSPQGSWIEETSTASTALTATIGGLAAETAYDVQVRAANDEGPGAWSASVTGSTTARPAVTLALDTLEIEEDGGVGTVTATVSPASPEAFEVSVSAAAMSPAEDGDFTVSGSTLSFAAGATESTGTVTITAHDNAVDAPDKTVSVSGTTAAAEVSAPDALTLTIADDDDAPGVGVAPSSAVEGQEVAFTVTLDAASGHEATVAYATSVESDDNAAADDFTDTNGRLTFAPGETSKTVNVPTTGDTEDEEDETFTLTLSGAANAVLGAGSSAKGTIDDDDETALVVAPVWAVTVSVPGIAEAEGTSTVTVSTGGVTLESDATIELDFSGGSATEGVDYKVGSKTLTLTAGASSVETTITAVIDSVVEDVETISVLASVGGNLIGSQRTVSIADDDEPAWEVTVDPDTIAEADTGSSTATVSTGGVTFAGDLSIELELAGTADETADYTVESKALTLLAGENETTTTFTAVDDAVDDDGEEIGITAKLDGAAIGEPQTLTITDDDEPNAAPGFAETSETREVAENTAADESFGAPVAATDADGDTLAYTLGGTDAAAFGIDAASGQLETKAALDHEAKPSYAVTVTAVDGKGGSASVDVTVTVTNVDEEPDAPAAPVVVPAGADSVTVTWTAPANAGRPDITDYDYRYRTSDPQGSWTAGPSTTSTALTATIGGLAANTAYEVQVRATNDEDTGEWSASGTGSTTSKPLVTLVLGAAEIEEDGGASTVTATVSPVSTMAFEVTVTAAAVPPAKAGDFTLSGSTLSFAANAGSSTGAVTITAVGNAVDGPDKTVTVLGTTTAAGVTGPAAVTLMIADDEATPEVSVAAATATEGVSAEFTVTLDAASGREVTVAFATSVATDDTASSADFTHTSGTLTFAPGDTSKTVDVPTTDDTADEPYETFTLTLTLSDSSNAVLGTASSARGTIVDGDNAPAVEVVPSSALEGKEVVFTVALDAASGREVTVDYATSVTTDDTASSADFTDKNGTLTFAPGDTSKTVDVPTTDDTADEADETFTLTLSGPSNAVLGTVSSATGTITDNDVAPVWAVTVSVPRIAEADTGSSTVTVSTGGVTFAADRSIALEFGGSATEGVDYEVGSKTLTLNAGENSARTTIMAKDDAVDEYAETIVITAKDDGTAIGEPQTVTILDDDGVPMFAEGSTATRSVAENTGAGMDIGAAVSATDADGDPLTYTLAGPDAASFAIVGTSGQLQTSAALDHEAKSSYAVTVTADDGKGGSDTIAVTITVTNAKEPPDAPAKPTVSATADAADSLDVSWAVPANAGRPDIMGYDLQYRAGTSGPWTAGPQDETGTSATIGSLSADTAYEVQVRATNDEGNSAWSVAGSASTSEPEVSVAAASASEGDAVEFTVTLGTASSQQVTVDWATSVASGDTAAAADFTGVNGTVTFDPGDTSETVSVSTVEDMVVEDDETFTLTLSSPSNAVLGTTGLRAKGTITDDDERGVTVLPTDLTFTEEGSGDYTVVLSSEPTDDVTVALTVTGDADVTVSPTPLTFTSTDWSTAQTVTVSAADDADTQDDSATVSHAVSGADYGDNSVTADDVSVTVTDNETASTGVRLTVSATKVGEEDGATVLTVTGTLDGATLATATDIAVSVSAGTATETTDYTADTATLTIAAGQSSGTASITLTPVNDALDEGDETVAIDATTASGLTLTPAAVTVTITDDDTAGVTVSPTAVTATEGGPTGSYTVVLDTQPTGTVMVTVGDTSDDIAASPETLTFTTANWNTAQTVTVTADDDQIAEGEETATLTHAVSGYGTVTTADSVTVTIADNDTAGVTVRPDGGDGDRGRPDRQLHGGARHAADRHGDGDRRGHQRRHHREPRDADVHHCDLGHVADGDGDSHGRQQL